MTVVTERSARRPMARQTAWIKDLRGWAVLGSNQLRPLPTHTHFDRVSAHEQGVSGRPVRGLSDADGLSTGSRMVEKWSCDGWRLFAVVLILAALVLLLAPLPGAGS